MVGWNDEYMLDHITACMKRFQIWGFESLDPDNMNAAKDRLRTLKWSQYASVSVSYTKFQCSENQEVHILRCTGTRQWRKKSPRNDHAFLFTGTVKPNELQSTQQRIPALLRCLFKIEDCDNSQTALLAVVWSLKVNRYIARLGVIQRSAPTESVDKGVSFGGCRTYVVLIRAIEYPAHLIPLSLNDDNNKWLLDNCINLKIFNLLETTYWEITLICNNIR